MSRLLQHISHAGRTLKCDCAAASSSKRSLVSLAVPRAGVSCPARPTQTQRSHFHGYGHEHGWDPQDWAASEAAHKAFDPWYRPWAPAPSGAGNLSAQHQAQRQAQRNAQRSASASASDSATPSPSESEAESTTASSQSRESPWDSNSRWGPQSHSHWHGRHDGWNWQHQDWNQHQHRSNPHEQHQHSRHYSNESFMDRLFAAWTSPSVFHRWRQRGPGAWGWRTWADRAAASDHGWGGGGWGRGGWWGWGRGGWWGARSSAFGWPGWGGWGWGGRNGWYWHWMMKHALAQNPQAQAHWRAHPYMKHHWHHPYHHHQNYYDFAARAKAEMSRWRSCFGGAMRPFATSPFARNTSPFGQRLERACPRGVNGQCNAGRGWTFGGGCGGRRQTCGGCPGAQDMVGVHFARLMRSSSALGAASTTGSPDMHASQKRFYSIQRVSVYVNVEPGTGTPNSVGIGINGPGGVRFTTLSISTRPTPIRRPVSGGDCVQIQKRTFKATSKCEGAPLFVWLAGALKSSSALGLVHTITRVAMTLVPFTLIKLKLVSKFLTKLPAEDPKRAKLTHQLHVSRKLIIALFVVPASVFWAALMASLERTPLTGRWRLILMSPQEEDDVSKQLQGPGWYNAVADILLSNSEGKMPKVVPVSDWRYKWVDETLRQLESFLPVFRDEAAYAETFAQQRTFPTPPPSRFPLVPRPRISQLLHCFLSESSINAVLGSPKEKDGTDTDVDAAHSILGPPYNLLLVDKPDTSNGFSYGFGGHGAAGIVVFSGFLDEILQSTTMQAPAPTPSPPALQEKNGWSSYLGLGTAPVPAHAPDPVPTAEQTAQLAVLLAHEISHLMLAHHLETLSNSTIFAPGVLGIFGDVFRTILFPLTMLFGPFVNDAVANMTKVSRSEILEGHEACFNRKLEIEADIVSARILAYAGFDPRIAVEFWESRLGPADHAHDKKPKHTGAGHFWRGGSSKKRDTHPVREERIQRLKAELARWEVEWQKPRLALRNLSPSPST